MRFDQFGYSEFRDTYRKRLAFLRKQLRERERYRLFADQVAAEQIDVDTEMAQRQAIWNKEDAASRAYQAQRWHQARAKLATYPDDERRELLAYWQHFTCPGVPEYLLTVLRAYDSGRLNMNPPPLRETEECRKAVNETIRRIRERAASRNAIEVTTARHPRCQVPAAT